MLLDQDSFLTQLTKILEKSRETGTIYVTFKRCASRPAPKRMPPRRVSRQRARASAGIPGTKTSAKATPEQLANAGCLVRAVGAHQKISCMITADKLTRFTQSYGNILKVSLDSLKKREKKKDVKKEEKKAGGGSRKRAGSAREIMSIS